MSELDQKLKALFPDGERKIVFWYDADGDFNETVDSLDLDPVRIHRLTGTNQFETKYLIEREDTASSFLIYAPFQQPKPEEDFLLDLYLYAESFSFDRGGMLCAEFNAPKTAQPVFNRFRKFFDNSIRIAKFKRLRLEHFSEREVALGIMGVLCGASHSALNEILQKVLFHESPDQQIAEFNKYGVDGFFWQEAEQHFGYADSQPAPFRLAVSCFLTGAVQSFEKKEIPKNWQSFILPYSSNVSFFLYSIRNISDSKQPYQELASQIADEMQVKENLRRVSLESLRGNETFDEIDQTLIAQLAERLLSGDALSKAEYFSEWCAERIAQPFWEEHKTTYQMITGACGVLLAEHYEAPAKIADLVAQYQAEDWKIDQAYRHFYTAFDQLNDAEREISRADELRKKVEDVYHNVYLENVVSHWTKALAALPDWNQAGFDRQIHFYQNRIEGKNNERTVVIISDALRYEVAQELADQLNKIGKKTTAVIEPMIGSLPSITELGMTALLPHQELGYSQGKFTLDGETAETIEKRRKILQKRKPLSDAVQITETLDWDSGNLRSMFTSAKLYYVYHNQIDARGDKAASEKEVFRACQDAITEIIKLVTRLSNSASISHFIITADHGFLYKRDPLAASEKIAGVDIPSDGKRYGIISGTVDELGMRTFSLGQQLESANPENVLVPMGAHIFKHPGAGLNYVHGGASPQEIFLPVIDVKVAHSQAKFSNASIDLICPNRKITCLNTSLEFLQDSPVGGHVKRGNYELVFVDERDMEISDKLIYEAASTEPESSRRIFKLSFALKSIQYDPHKTYFLKLIDKNGRMAKEKTRWPFTIDIIFSEDFGF